MTRERCVLAIAAFDAISARLSVIGYFIYGACACNLFNFEIVLIDIEFEELS